MSFWISIQPINPHITTEEYVNADLCIGFREDRNVGAVTVILPDGQERLTLAKTMQEIRQRFNGTRA